MKLSWPGTLGTSGPAAECIHRGDDVDVTRQGRIAEVLRLAARKKKRHAAGIAGSDGWKVDLMHPRRRHHDRLRPANATVGRDRKEWKPESAVLPYRIDIVGAVYCK